MSPDRSQLDSALSLFEKVEANLVKLERLWAELRRSPTSERRDEAVLAYGAILPHLPAVGGYVPETLPMTSAELETLKLEVLQWGEAEDALEAEQRELTPGAELGRYRFHFDAQRKKIVRDRLIEVVTDIDEQLRTARAEVGFPSSTGFDWTTLSDRLAELDRLVGSDVQQRGRWSDLHRHVHFGQDVDLHDIVEMDWPSVRAGITSHLYDDDEPIPVAVGDLVDVVESRPRGAVSTGLRWDALSDTDFERLIFELTELRLIG